MSFAFATPEYVQAAAADLANLGSTISSANSAAVAPTSAVLAAGTDEVSASVAALFGAHAQAYQALSAPGGFFPSEVRAAHGRRCGPVRCGGGRERLAAADPRAGRAGRDRRALPDVHRTPLIGDGANGTAASPNGGAGGWLYGNGYASSTAGVAGGNGGSAGLVGNGGNGNTPGTGDTAGKYGGTAGANGTT